MLQVCNEPMEIDPEPSLAQELRADPYFLPRPALRRETTESYIPEYQHKVQSFGSNTNSGSSLEFWEKVIKKTPTHTPTQAPPQTSHYFLPSFLDIPKEPITIKVSKGQNVWDNF